MGQESKRVRKHDDILSVFVQKKKCSSVRFLTWIEIGKEKKKMIKRKYIFEENKFEWSANFHNNTGYNFSFNVDDIRI